MSFAIVLALLLAIIVVLKNSKFNFLFKKNKEKDVLQFEAEHHNNGLDK